MIRVTEEKREATFLLLVDNIATYGIAPKIVSDDPEVFDIELPSGSIEPGKRGEIRVALAHDFELSAKKTSFTIEFDDARHTRYTIPVEIGSEPPRAGGSHSSVTRNTSSGAQTTASPLQPTTGEDKKKDGKQ